MNRIYVALLFCVLTLTAVTSCGAYCTKNEIEFRPILSDGELEGKSYDVVKNGQESLYVWSLHYLSDCDLERVDIKRSVTNANKFMIVIRFNENGRKRLYHFTKTFAKKRVAIFAEGKLVAAPLVWTPNFIGSKVVIRWPGSEKDLKDFANRVNNGNPSIIALYIEEQRSYNDAAADEWAKYYADINNSIEVVRRRFTDDAGVTESDRDF